HHLFSFGDAHFVVAAIVGGVIIRRVGLELGGAGIDEPIAWGEAQVFPQRANVVLGLACEMGNLPVRKTERFGFGENVRVHDKKSTGGNRVNGGLRLGACAPGPGLCSLSCLLFNCMPAVYVRLVSAVKESVSGAPPPFSRRTSRWGNGISIPRARNSSS